MTGAIVLDVETTGLSPREHRITEIAIVDFASGNTLIHTYVNPQVKIPADITRITGISDETVKDAPAFYEIAEPVADFIGLAKALIGHNPWFDRSMLAAEFTRSQTMVRWPTLICTKRLWDLHEPKEQRHLQNAYKRFVDKEGFTGAHGALADTKACHAVAKAQIEYFNLQERSWEEFDPEQTVWYGPSSHVVWRDGILVVNFGKNKDVPCHKVDAGFWRWISKQEFPEHVMVLADYMSAVAKPNITGEELATWAYGRSV